MPEGRLGLPRITSIGPLVEKTDKEKWRELQHKADKRVEELGL